MRLSAITRELKPVVPESLARAVGKSVDPFNNIRFGNLANTLKQSQAWCDRKACYVVLVVGSSALCGVCSKQMKSSRLTSAAPGSQHSRTVTASTLKANDLLIFTECRRSD